MSSAPEMSPAVILAATALPTGSTEAAAFLPSASVTAVLRCQGDAG